MIATILVAAAVLGAVIKLWTPLSRPVRWLWRRNVSDPAGSWFAARVDEVLQTRLTPVHAQLDELEHQVSLNGKGPLKNAVLAQGETLALLQADVATLLKRG